MNHRRVTADEVERRGARSVVRLRHDRQHRVVHREQLPLARTPMLRKEAAGVLHPCKAYQMKFRIVHVTASHAVVRGTYLPAAQRSA